MIGDAHDLSVDGHIAGVHLLIHHFAGHTTRQVLDVEAVVRHKTRVRMRIDRVLTTTATTNNTAPFK